MIKRYRYEEAVEEVKGYDMLELQSEYAKFKIKSRQDPENYMFKSYSRVLGNELLHRKNG